MFEKQDNFGELGLEENHPYEKITGFVLTSRGGFAEDNSPSASQEKRMSLYIFDKDSMLLRTMRRFLILHCTPLKSEAQVLRQLDLLLHLAQITKQANAAS